MRPDLTATAIPRYPVSAFPTCKAPARERNDSLSLTTLDGLEGDYLFTIVTTTHPRLPGASYTTARGTLQLWRADSARRHFTLEVHHAAHFDPNVVYPLAGVTNVDFDKIAANALLHPADSRDPDEPGVQMERDGTMTIGNSAGPKGIGNDIGLFFTLDSVAPGYFGGHWAHGAPIKPLPIGYFCAVKSSKPNSSTDDPEVSRKSQRRR